MAIWVESESGRGSTFHFTASMQRQRDAAANLTALYRRNLQSLPVLVVDDNATNRRILEEALVSWEMKPTLISDGPAALSALKQAQEVGDTFPLVLLDATMPEMDGFAVAARIKEKPTLAGAVIMMLSSTGQVEDAIRCRDLRLDAHLTKPIRRSELLDAILTALGNTAALKAEDDTDPPATPARKPLRILLAEDNPVNQQLAIRLLEKAGHSVQVANNGRKAVEAAANSSFDVILMDVQMPVMGGLEATAAIREQQRISRTRVPIVAMTAHAIKGDRERCLAAGMDHYVTKPIDPKRLFAAIDEVVGGELADISKLGNGTQSFARARLDRTRLLMRVEGDRALLKELVVLFMEDTPKVVEELRRAIAEGEANKIQRTAHTLKGAVGNFGAARAVELARKIEAAGREKDLDSVAEAFAELEKEIAALFPELSNLIMECGDVSPLSSASGSIGLSGDTSPHSKAA